MFPIWLFIWFLRFVLNSPTCCTGVDYITADHCSRYCWWAFWCRCIPTLFRVALRWHCWWYHSSITIVVRWWYPPDIVHDSSVGDSFIADGTVVTLNLLLEFCDAVVELFCGGVVECILRWWFVVVRCLYHSAVLLCGDLITVFYDRLRSPFDFCSLPFCHIRSVVGAIHCWWCRLFCLYPLRLGDRWTTLPVVRPFYNLLLCGRLELLEFPLRGALLLIVTGYLGKFTVTLPAAIVAVCCRTVPLPLSFRWFTFQWIFCSVFGTEYFVELPLPHIVADGLYLPPWLFCVIACWLIYLRCPHYACHRSGYVVASVVVFYLRASLLFIYRYYLLFDDLFVDHRRTDIGDCCSTIFILVADYEFTGIVRFILHTIPVDYIWYIVVIVELLFALLRYCILLITLLFVVERFLGTFIPVVTFTILRWCCLLLFVLSVWAEFTLWFWFDINSFYSLCRYVVVLFTFRRNLFYAVAVTVDTIYNLWLMIWWFSCCSPLLILLLRFDYGILTVILPGVDTAVMILPCRIRFLSLWKYLRGELYSVFILWYKLTVDFTQQLYYGHSVNIYLMMLSLRLFVLVGGRFVDSLTTGSVPCLLNRIGVGDQIRYHSYRYCYLLPDCCPVLGLSLILRWYCLPDTLFCDYRCYIWAIVPTLLLFVR